MIYLQVELKIIIFSTLEYFKYIAGLRLHLYTHTHVYIYMYHKNCVIFSDYSYNMLVCAKLLFLKANKMPSISIELLRKICSMSQCYWKLMHVLYLIASTTVTFPEFTKNY